MIIILLSLIAGLLYRFGGMGKPFNRYYRRLGVPAIVLITLILLHRALPWWAYLSVFALQFGTLTTYFKFGKQADVVWYNWALTGLFCSLAVLPVVCVTHTWMGFCLRSGLILGVYVVVSELFDSVWIEELGRGAVLVATLPLLFV